MADTKISAATDAGTLLATDMVPLARSASTTAYHATMAEVGVFTNTNLPVASTSTAGVVKVDGSTITIASGTISAAAGALPATTPPAMDGPANAGVLSTYSRGDHVHPNDTSRAPLASPTFTGTPAAPTPTTGDNSTKLATTAFVQAQMVASGAGVSTWNTRAGAVVLQQSDLTALNVYDDAGRNRTHNCGFSINQRAYVSGTALGAGAYGHDRWKAGASGCTYTFTQNQPLTTITITAGTLQQVVEAMGVAAGTYTLSWTGTAQGRVNAGSYAASPVTAAGLPANTNITIEFNTGTLGAVQLEIGAQVTPLDYGGSPQQVLAQCQRFFQTGNIYFAGSGIAANACIQSMALAVAMRATPTCASNFSAQTNCSGGTVAGLAPGAVYASATVTSTAQTVYLCTFTASADL